MNDAHSIRVKLSRRALVALTPAAMLVADGTAVAAEHDETRAACLNYVAMEDRVTELLEEWATLEHQLAKRHADFFRLSLEEQHRLPGGHRFREIEQELDVLDRGRDKLLPQLSRMGSTSPAAVLAMLMVTERIVHPEDHPAAHTIIVGAVRDLGRLIVGRAR